MNRKQLLAAMAGSAIGITLVDTATAEAAMGARIDSPLNVYTNGVSVTGTVSHWDSDAASAVFTASIVQGIHVASGRSQRYRSGAPKFWLWASGDGLKAGPAMGHGVAHILNKNGSTETYRWTVAVELQ
jgi:hypothetical protein